MNGNSQMQACRNCNAPMYKGALICTSCGARKKKPFYLRAWFIILLIVVIALGYQSITGGKKTEKEMEPIKWSEIQLSGMIPEPKSNVGKLLYDSKDNLNIDIHKITKSDYREYVDACRAKGFDIESKDTDFSYSAYGKEGHKLTLMYMDSSQELSIKLDSPKKMDALTWPTSDLVKLLPVPKSGVGTISIESSEKFRVYLGETTKEDFAAYIDECSKKGFSLDYNKSDTSYDAANANGYRISLRYEGNKVVSIEINAPKESSLQDAAKKEEKPADQANDVQVNAEVVPASSEQVDSSGGLRPEFKAAMDSYEAFYDEYLDVLKKYQNNPSDLTLLSEYTDIMERSLEVNANFEAWGSKDMNQDEALYYIEVSGRIAQKLLGAM